MKLFLLLSFLLSFGVFAQRVETIDADCLKFKNGVCIDKDEFGALDGVTSGIQSQLNDKHQKGDESITGVKTFTGKLVTQSTSNGSIPCPSMTEVQRNAIASPVAGDCVFNSTTNSLNVYNGTLWKAAGGGLSAWETAFSYAVGDIVIESDKIYQALEAHTSGTFATDLASAKWKRLNNELTINSTTAKTLEVPYNQVTVTGTDKALIETGNSNRLINPGFEHSTIWTGWTTGCTGTATLYMGGSSLKYEGKQVLEFEVIGGVSGGQCTIYQNAETVAVDGVVAIAIHSENASGVKVLKKTNIYDIALEKEILGKSEWQKIELVGKLGSSETGVAIEVTVGASETKEVHLDEAKVAIEDAKTAVDSTRYVGSMLFANNANTSCSEVPTTTSWTIPDLTGCPSLAQIDGDLSLSSTSAIPSFNIKTKPGARYVISVKDFIYKLTSTGATDCSIGIYLNGVGTRIRQIASNDPDSHYVQNVASSFYEFTGDGAVNEISYRVRSSVASACEFMTRLGELKLTVVEYPSSASVVYSTEADFFSTDTNTLTFKGTAITDSDPVGTFNTYSYAENSNTKTICGTAPTQTIADMKANGIQIFVRPYNAASTCGNPARVEVKLGKGMTVVTPSLYKNTGKDIALITNYYKPNAEISYGILAKDYSDSSGVYIFDGGFVDAGTTNHSILGSDISSVTSGYLVINAQPKKTTAVADFKQFDYVYVEATNSSTQSIANTGVTRIVSWTEVSDLTNSFNPTTGTFTVPRSNSIYRICLKNGISGFASESPGIRAYNAIEKNSSGGSYRTIDTRVTTGTYDLLLMTGCTELSGLNAGETLNFITTQNSSASKNSAGGVENNYLTITRISGQF